MGFEKNKRKNPYPAILRSLSQVTHKSLCGKHQEKGVTFCLSPLSLETIGMAFIFAIPIVE